MHLVFTKGADKTDTLDLIRDGETTRIDNPKQRIIPHDMVHFAVESVLGARGFLGRVAAGEAAALTMAGNPVSDGVERLVETIQGDGWSGGEAAPADVIALYRTTCEARGCPALPVDEATILAIRAAMDDLTRRWAAVPVGGSLTLALA